MAKLLAFCGSSRKESFNQRLLDVVVKAARHAGADITSITLNDYPMPIYNGDDEAESGLPDGARRLKELMHQHDGYIIGCPEYNGFMTPLLMNTLDWCSRSEEASPDLSAYGDRPILITSASPGQFGGARSAAHLRTMLSGIGAIVLPWTISVPRAADTFDDAGALKDEKLASRIERTAARFNGFVDHHRRLEG